MLPSLIARLYSEGAWCSCPLSMLGVHEKLNHPSAELIQVPRNVWGQANTFLVRKHGKYDEDLTDVEVKRLDMQLVQFASGFGKDP